MTHGVEVGKQAGAGRDFPRSRLIRVARLFLRLVAYMIIVVGAALFGGFLIFYQTVASMRPPVAPKADAIVVLTGGYQRIDHGVQLLADGAGKRLLISGVNPATSGNHLRLLTRSTTDLFECCVDLGHEALDTAGNAAETTRWIKAHGYQKIILVTNNYHMPRSLAEIRRADHRTTYIAYPVESELSFADIGRNPLLLRTLASEYVKFLLVQSRDWTGITI